MTKAEQIRALRERKFAGMGDAADIAADLTRRMQIAAEARNQVTPQRLPHQRPWIAPTIAVIEIRRREPPVFAPKPVGRCKDDDSWKSERTREPWKTLGISRRTYYRRKKFGTVRPS